MPAKLKRTTNVFNYYCLSRFKVGYSYLTTRPYSQTQYSSRSNKASSFLVSCNSQITKIGRNGDIELAKSISSRMPTKDTITWTAMLTAYVDNGQTSLARQMFDEMLQRNIASYNAMITGYSRSKGRLDEAFELFLRMPVRNEDNIVMITGLVKAGMFEEAEKIYGDMPVEWREPICSNLLLNGFLKAGRMGEEVRVLEGLEDRNVVSETCMVDGYCKMGRVVDARDLFDRMLERSVVTWTGMIDGYMRMGMFGAIFEMFLNMIREGMVEVNSTTMTIMLEACGCFGRCGEGIQMHGLSFRMGFYFDEFCGNCIIKMYCACDRINEAANMFH